MFFFTPLFYALLAVAGLSNALPQFNFPPNMRKYHGSATFYNGDPGMGTCGKMSTGTELVVAVSSEFFNAHGAGDDPTKNPLCGKVLTIHSMNTGMETKATVVGDCPDCGGLYDVKVSLAAMVQLDKSSIPQGHTNVYWFENGSPKGFIPRAEDFATNS
ncbi:hypothetical protein BC835DRAFT_1413433 [Cytidiella melzeri]|nr:hypothetical protein BC835DRAFT_1413433 [Cytidiella melzeri]